MSENDGGGHMDCGDNSCEFAPKRGGMRTNGGCRCLDGLSVDQRRKVRAFIHTARAALASDGLDAISDALHRIGVGDAPRLVDRIAGLGEELTRLRKAAQERDGLRAEVERLTESRRFDAVTIDRVGRREAETETCLRQTTAERDSLRQQLEEAQAERNTAREQHDIWMREATDLKSALTAAQARIGELEAKQVSDDERIKSLNERANALVSAGAAAVLEAASNLRALVAAQRRIAELERKNAACNSAVDSARHQREELHTITSALRAIAPVYRMMVRWRDQEGISWDEAYGTIDDARAAITPEQLELIERVVRG